MKTADEIPEMPQHFAEPWQLCINPSNDTWFKLKAKAETLKKERDRYRVALDDIKLVGTYKFANSHYTFIRRERVFEIINEVLK